MDSARDYRKTCAGMGRLEYVVESRHGSDRETWLVVRPEPGLASRYQAMGVELSPGCRVVVEAESLRPVGVIADDLPEPPPPFGYNPYFDLPPG